MKFEFEIRVCPIEVRVHLPNHPGDGALHEKLDEILEFLTAFKGEIMSAITDITAQVAAQTTVVASVVTLLQQIKAALDAAIANGADPVELAALSAAISQNTTALADAVIANTPVPPAVP